MTASPDAPALGTFWLLRLDSILVNMVEPRVPTTFRRMGTDEASVLAQTMDMQEVEQRFAAGKRCYVALVEGKLAAYGWATFDQEAIGELGLLVHLKPGEAYIWDCVTLPEYRGLRLYPALLAYIARELQAGGFQRVWIGANADNVASQSGMRQVGFVPIADVTADSELGMSRLWLRGQPGVPEQLVRDAGYALFGDATAIYKDIMKKE